MAPSDCWLPSPKSTVTSLMFAVLPTFTVNVAGKPAETGVVGPAMDMPVRGFRPTVTSAVFPATLAVTFAVRGAFTVVVATPDASVMAVEGFSVPWSVVNVTGTPDKGLPDTSSTRAEMVDVPPPGGSD